VQGAERDRVGGPDVVGLGERDEDGCKRRGGAREAARGVLRPPEQLAREAREAAERGVNVARSEHQAERLRRWGSEARSAANGFSSGSAGGGETSGWGNGGIKTGEEEEKRRLEIAATAATGACDLQYGMLNSMD